MSIPDETAKEPAESHTLDEASKLPSRLIYEVIRRDGEVEIRRPLASLAWSGTAAGIMISFSLLGEAIFRTYLPDASHSYLIKNLGYSLGFLVVILGRMQLFTENTITTVLPILAKPSLRLLGCVARLWLVVLAANVVGAFAVAAFFAYTAAIPSELLPAIQALSEHAIGMPAGESFWRAIPAGILIAAGDFAHIVAGSVEMAYLLLRGDLSVGAGLSGFFLPVLAGNIVGGTAIFTVLAWGQVKEEVPRGLHRVVWRRRGAGPTTIA
ncbi:MAG: formate/nitrite transporter family protein [Rhodospirillales bacterium]